MKKLILFILLLVISGSAFSQQLVVHHFDSSGNETGVETYKHGDYIVIAHEKKGKKMHFFEGKITGLYPKKGVIKVLDLARSTRVMPIVGKKISIDEIVGVLRPDTKMMKKRENNAIAAATAAAIGSSMGSKTGDDIFYGAVGEEAAYDFASRLKADRENIKCEITK